MDEQRIVDELSEAGFWLEVAHKRIDQVRAELGPDQPASGLVQAELKLGDAIHHISFAIDYYASVVSSAKQPA